MFRIIAVGIISAGLFASVAYACCVFDNDPIAEEIAAFPDALATIAGRIEREPPERLESTVERGLNTEITGEEFQDRMRAAEALDLLDRQSEALDLLESMLPQLGSTHALRARQQMMLAAMHLWWRGGDDVISAERALELAREHNDLLPDNDLMGRIIKWAEQAEPAHPERLLPDFFGLRLAPNKSAISDNSQLEQRGLRGDRNRGPDHLLLYLLRRHPAWENFDTYYALSLIWAVDGKQPLAHYARARAWLEHASARPSRVPGAAEMDDIRPQTLIRTMRGPALVDVTPVSIEYRNVIEAYLTDMRRFVVVWQAERKEFAAARLAETGPAAPDFWAGFRSSASPPKDTPYHPPPRQPQAPEAAAPKSESETPRLSQPEKEETGGPSPTMLWGMLGGLAVLLGFGFALHRRAGPAPEPEQDTEPGQDT
jgi:hypothetical protein